MSAVFAASATITVVREPSGIVLHNGEETLRLTVCSPAIIHVVSGPGDPWPHPRSSPGL